MINGSKISNSFRITNSLLPDECGHPSIIRNSVVAIKGWTEILLPLIIIITAPPRQKFSVTPSFVLTHSSDSICIGNSMTCSGISKFSKYHSPLRGSWYFGKFWNITRGIIAKYYVQVMLLFVYNRSREIFGNAQETFLFTVEKNKHRRLRS